MTLGQSAFGATQTVLGKYAGAGLPGFYTLIQGSDRVDVVPSQVFASAGGLRNVTPVMSSPVQFPLATRGVIDTLQLVVQSHLIRQRGQGDSAEHAIQANGYCHDGCEWRSRAGCDRESGQCVRGADVVAECLYDATDKTYYLNIHAVFPPNPAGVAPIRGLIPRVSEGRGPQTVRFSKNSEKAIPGAAWHDHRSQFL